MVEFNKILIVPNNVGIYINCNVPSLSYFKDVYIDNTAIVAGPYESKGPMEMYFDKKYDDLRIGMQSFEKAEMKMMDDAIKIILKKTKYTIDSIGCVFSGDLINQNIITNLYKLHQHHAMYLLKGRHKRTRINGNLILEINI